MSETKYFDVKETAAFVRADLKKVFPKTKFSVRIDRYSMGASVDISWTDGPTEEDVRNVAGGYCGQGFNGMDDSTFAIFGERDGVKVRYGATHIGYRREVTDAILQRALNVVTAETPELVKDVVVSGNQVHMRDGGWDHDRCAPVIMTARRIRAFDAEPVRIEPAAKSYRKIQ